MSYAEQNAGTSKPTTIFSSQGDIGDSGSGSVVLFSIKVINDTQQYANFSEAPQVEAYYSTWYWCVQTFYNVSATPSRISNIESTTEMLWKSDEMSSGQYLDGSAYIPLIANSTGRLFNVSANVNTNLFPYIYKLLTREIVDVYPHAGSYNDDESLDLSTFLYTTDMKNATESMAEALTNQIRSSAPGDNSRATAFAGDTFINETYIRVTWPWLILPLAETLGTTVLLITTMVLSRHHRLLKTSIIALLVYGLDGWRADEIKIPDPEDAEKLEAMAHVMRARLMDNGNGRFQFVRA
ncbi:hypothetical protein Daus18300_013209 [Diaporthe australafricana]|uniref:Uncharacterized protein n=1 Tax=Diaporthe australafricana TaxID=127596 RepID=A0ABR3VZY2_9PEZI